MYFLLKASSLGEAKIPAENMAEAFTNDRLVVIVSIYGYRVLGFIHLDLGTR
jgi:hypothetical protein